MIKMSKIIKNNANKDKLQRDYNAFEIILHYSF